MSQLGAHGVGASTLANYAMVAGQSLRTLLVARVLGPSEFGVLNIANVGTNFSMYSEMGTGTVGEQRASRARGLGHRDDARVHLVATTRARMWTSLVLAAVLAPLAAVLLVVEQTTLGRALLFIAVSGPLQMVWFACRGWLRVMHEFRLAMWGQLTQVTVWVVVVPVVALRWGLVGAMASMVLSYLPPVFVAARHVPIIVFIRPSWREFRALLPAGLPVWAMAVSSFLMVYVDQILVGVLLGSEALGLYAVAMLTANALLAFSDGAAAAAHPQTLESFARAGRFRRDEPSVVRVMHVVELAFSALVPLSWLGMAFVAQVVLTDYRTAMGLVAVLGAVSVLIGIPTASNATLLAVGLHRKVPKLFLLGTAVKVAVALLLTRFTTDPLLAGVASWCGTAVYSALYLRLVSNVLHPDAVGRMRFVFDHLAGAIILSLAAAVACWSHVRYGLVGFSAVAAATLLITGPLAILRFQRSRTPGPE